MAGEPTCHRHCPRLLCSSAAANPKPANKILINHQFHNCRPSFSYRRHLCKLTAPPCPLLLLCPPLQPPTPQSLHLFSTLTAGVFFDASGVISKPSSRRNISAAHRSRIDLPATAQQNRPLSFAVDPATHHGFITGAVPSSHPSYRRRSLTRTLCRFEKKERRLMK